MKRINLTIFLFITLTLAITALGVYRNFSKNNPPTENVNTQGNQITLNPSSTSVSKKSYIYEPIKDFKKRVTKKPFGIFITPQTSPIQPEKFHGYHTGADAEYGDVATTVPVYATQNGIIVYSGYVSGYGGVLVLTGKVDNQDVRFLYGHLNPSQLTPINTTVNAGQQIGILGKDYSQETDYERKHLHFAIIKGTKTDFRGYVQDKNELLIWLDPMLLNYQTLK